MEMKEKEKEIEMEADNKTMMVQVVYVVYKLRPFCKMEIHEK